MTAEHFLDGRVTVYGGDSRDVLRTLPDASIDSIVTDPPYALVSIQKRFGKAGSAPAQHGRDGLYTRASAGFMGKDWDTGETAFAVEFWAEVMRVLKPGGHVVAFGGTRSFHRLVCAIEDAGFEIRDQLAWLYGTGFPKSHDVSKGIDKAAGHWRGRAGEVIDRTVGQVAKGTEYQRTDKGDPVTPESARWSGWGTALKPALEPICLARKPLDGTVAETVLRWGTGAINVDGCRVGTEVRFNPAAGYQRVGVAQNANILSGTDPNAEGREAIGRWPANLVHDGSDEVVGAFPEAKGAVSNGRKADASNGSFLGGLKPSPQTPGFADEGSAARFFYSAKADGDDRLASKHPTVKPVDLMRWLVRLVTPPGGVVLDPFAGTGTTGEAAWREGFSAVLIEREPDYRHDISRRLALVAASMRERKQERAKSRPTTDLGPLFTAFPEAAE